MSITRKVGRHFEAGLLFYFGSFPIFIPSKPFLPIIRPPVPITITSMQEAPLHTERELLARIAAGDETAFRQVFHDYWPQIYGVSLMLTKSVHLAEDMTQEVFLKIWLKRENLPEIKSFRDYLFIVARNHIFDELRRRSREEPFAEAVLAHFSDERPTPEQELLYKESTRIIQDTIEQLPPQQLAVYRMTREQGMSHEQIATALGISKNTVRNHVAQALGTIREALDRHTGDLLLYYIFILEYWLL
jgi:RNA polymerase sigma-70 factor (family 1)